MESDITVGHTVGATPLASAIVLTELSNVLCAGSGVTVHLAENIVQGVGGGVNERHDSVVGTENVVQHFAGGIVNEVKHLCGATPQPPGIVNAGNCAVHSVMEHVEVDFSVQVLALLLVLCHNSYLHNITVVALGHGVGLVFPQ